MADGDIWNGIDDEEFCAIFLEPIEKSSNSHEQPSAAVQDVETSDCLRVITYNQNAGPCEMPNNIKSNLSAKSSSKYAVTGGRTRWNNENVPIQKYRYGRIWVSDIVAQLWCEQQMLYKFEPPEKLIDTVIAEPEVVKIGSSLHLARELEIQDAVPVYVKTKEDRFAVKVINLLDAIVSLLEGGACKRREIPVFGAPYGMNVFIVGVIDEITCNPENLEMGIVEFKTRATNDLPSDAQTRTHNLQVMLYKKLFDDMARNVLTKAVVARHLKLNLHKILGRSVQLHLKDLKAKTLDHLLDLLFQKIEAVPYIFSLSVEYAFQGDSSTIGVRQVNFDENWLYTQLNHSFGFWKGKRQAAGVDIEDIWKCVRCPYNEVCVWRKNLNQEISEHVNDEKKDLNDVKVEESNCELACDDDVGPINNETCNACL